MAKKIPGRDRKKTTPNILMPTDGYILPKKYSTFSIPLTVIPTRFTMVAIGMTFEQGGGPRSGASVVTNNGDTLTLKDRIDHHFTTSMSTLEMVSKNTGMLVKELSNFLMIPKITVLASINHLWSRM